jgi:nucleoid DNA-binding protein
MDKYLLEILKEVNTIIIPGLGALTITNNKTGEVMFMPYLKHDDGNLAKFIAEKEGIDLNDAKNIIARYVREIESKLNVGETYDMFRFGSFSKNADGDVEFHSWRDNKETELSEKQDEHAQKSNEEVPIAVVTDEKPVKQEETIQEGTPEQKENAVAAQVPETENLPKKEDSMTTSAEEKLTSSQPEEIKEEIKEETKEEIKEETKESPMEVEVHFSEESTAVVVPPMPSSEPKQAPQEKEPLEKTTSIPPTEEKPEEIAVNASVKDESHKKEVTKTTTAQIKHDNIPSTTTPVESGTTKKRGVLFYSMVAGFVLVIGSALTIALFYNSLEPYLPFVGKSEADTTAVETKNEEPALETSDEEEAENESTSEPSENFSTTDEETATPNQGASENTKTRSNSPRISATGNGKYYLIVGSFRVKGNAERFSSDINESSVIECNNAFYVVLGSYDSSAEAKAHLKDVTGNFKPWVFQIPC